MKVVYKVLYPMGFENEVEDNFPTSLPFVEIKPLEALDNEQSQFLIFQNKMGRSSHTRLFEEIKSVRKPFSSIRSG